MDAILCSCSLRWPWPLFKVTVGRQRQKKISVACSRQLSKQPALIQLQRKAFFYVTMTLTLQPFIWLLRPSYYSWLCFKFQWRVTPRPVTKTTLRCAWRVSRSFCRTPPSTGSATATTQNAPRPKVVIPSFASTAIILRRASSRACACQTTTRRRA